MLWSQYSVLGAEWFLPDKWLEGKCLKGPSFAISNFKFPLWACIQGTLHSCQHSKAIHSQHWREGLKSLQYWSWTPSWLILASLEFCRRKVERHSCLTSLYKTQSWHVSDFSDLPKKGWNASVLWQAVTGNRLGLVWFQRHKNAPTFCGSGFWLIKRENKVRLLAGTLILCIL